MKYFNFSFVAVLFLITTSCSKDYGDSSVLINITNIQQQIFADSTYSEYITFDYSVRNNGYKYIEDVNIIFTAIDDEYNSYNEEIDVLDLAIGETKNGSWSITTSNRKIKDIIIEDFTITEKVN